MNFRPLDEKLLELRGFDDEQEPASKPTPDLHPDTWATKRDLKELELRMLIKLGSLIVVGTGALAALQLLR